jgi:nucleotide-binding universal stress UspA family protein
MWSFEVRDSWGPDDSAEPGGVIMSQQILVPVDGSEQSFEAIELACALAKDSGDTLRLLHVVPNKEIPEGLKRFAAVEHINSSPVYMYETAVAENVLNVAKGRAADRGAKDIELSIEHGDAAKRILEVADREHADTIVMGTRGLSDIQGLVLGSVAHKVTHGASCRVVVVK